MDDSHFDLRRRWLKNRATRIQEEFYGREVLIADREMVESSSDDILAGASMADVAFLVVGDPFGCGSLHARLGSVAS